MRANFNIAGTNTGRLSSSESEFGTGTNQQNIDRSLKSIFIPDPGKKFVNIDLEQGDSRNLGAILWQLFLEEHGEKFAGAYLDACESGDLHTTVCQMAWTDLHWPASGAPFKDFRSVADQIFYRQDSYRQMAKKLGHGTNFVGQPATMAMHTKTPTVIIQEFQRKYFKAFPAIPAYHLWVPEEIARCSFLTNLHGRRRFFFGRPYDSATIREAVAFGAQSGTADAVNKAMIAIWRDYTSGGRLAKYHPELLCQVHDSLLFQVDEDTCDECVPHILELGRAELNLKNDRLFCVPNEAKIGWNWGDFDKKEPEKNPLGLIAWNINGDSRRNEKPPLTLSGR
jgi:DNA polymerase-1